VFPKHKHIACSVFVFLKHLSSTTHHTTLFNPLTVSDRWRNSAWSGGSS